MPDWFLPTRGRRRRAVTPETVRRTEVEDDGGRVVVETRLLGTRTPRGAWETTICPGDAPDPDGPEAAVFATAESRREAHLAHLQAVDFASAALKLTTRRLDQAFGTGETSAST